ncbi:MAG: S26 family signal peptidase [Planctomycetes bacterium]|nr:S26 family signal peptidase [Planctomycetota bacterium]
MRFAVCGGQAGLLHGAEAAAAFARGGRAVIDEDTCDGLGDASANSLDSRQWGAIPAKNITGRGWFVMTPSDGFHAAR